MDSRGCHGPPEKKQYIFWIFLDYSGNFRYTMVINGIQWYTYVYICIHWYTMDYYGILMYTIVYSIILWYTLVTSGLFWSSVGRFDQIERVPQASIEIVTLRFSAGKCRNWKPQLA